MAYPPHYSKAMQVLRWLQALVERELATARYDRRRALLDIQSRTEAAIASPLLLVDSGFAERAAAGARQDLAALENLPR